jgi:hypothetical protein
MKQMNKPTKKAITRRQALGMFAGGAGLLAAAPAMTSLAQDPAAQAIIIDPAPPRSNSNKPASTKPTVFDGL